MLFSLFEKSYILFMCMNKKVTNSYSKKLYKLNNTRNKQGGFKDVGSWNFGTRKYWKSSC